MYKSGDPREAQRSELQTWVIAAPIDCQVAGFAPYFSSFATLADQLARKHVDKMRLAANDPPSPQIVPPGTPFIDPPSPGQPKGPEEPPVIPPGQPYIDPPSPDDPPQPPDKPFVEV